MGGQGDNHFWALLLRAMKKMRMSINLDASGIRFLGKLLKIAILESGDNEMEYYS